MKTVVRILPLGSTATPIGHPSGDDCATCGGGDAEAGPHRSVWAPPTDGWIRMIAPLPLNELMSATTSVRGADV